MLEESFLFVSKYPNIWGVILVCIRWSECKGVMLLSDKVSEYLQSHTCLYRMILMLKESCFFLSDYPNVEESYLFVSDYPNAKESCFFLSDHSNVKGSYFSCTCLFGDLIPSSKIQGSAQKILCKCCTRRSTLLRQEAHPSAKTRVGVMTLWHILVPVGKAGILQICVI